MESGDDNAEKQSEEEIYNEDAVYIEDTVTTHRRSSPGDSKWSLGKTKVPLWILTWHGRLSWVLLCREEGGILGS